MKNIILLKFLGGFLTGPKKFNHFWNPMEIMRKHTRLFESVDEKISVLYILKREHASSNYIYTKFIIVHLVNPKCGKLMSPQKKKA